MAIPSQRDDHRKVSDADADAGNAPGVSGSARLARTLHGDVPRVDTVGILTAANPVGQRPLSARENSQRHIALRRDLVGHTPRQVRGHFDGLEHPFVVPNLSRAEIVRLGVRHGQGHVIFGERTGTADAEGMRFEVISTSDQILAQPPSGGVIATRTRWLRRGGDGRAVEDEGARFAIPYFDEEDDEGQEAAGFRGSRVLNYLRAEIPQTPEAQTALAKFLTCDARLRELLGDIAVGRGGAGGQFGGLYPARGVHHLRLVELHEALGDWRPFPIFSWADAWNEEHDRIEPYSA